MNEGMDWLKRELKLQGVSYSDELYEIDVDDDGNELVQPEDRCGFCGERRMDWLEWVEFGNYIRCATCGTVYRLSSEEA